MSPHTLQLVVCVAVLAAALAGWFAPSRFKLGAREVVLTAAGFTLAFALGHDWLTGMSLAGLFVGAYCAFSGWQSDAAPREACTAACAGAAWLFMITSREVVSVCGAGVLGLCAPRFAIWLTQRTNRAVGLGLVTAALLFQLSRVPLLLAR